MSSETSVKYPEKIWIQMVGNFEKDLEEVGESDKDFYKSLLNPGHTVKAEIPALNEFINNIKNSGLKDEFIDLIEKFENFELYKRFLAAALIYNRINGLPDNADKFLYICIAVEAAMHYESNPIKEKNKRFRSFFKENLSKESKLKMISTFKNRKVKNIIKGSNLANHRSFGAKLIKHESNTFLPSCYRQKSCFVEGSRCYPERICFLNDSTESKIDEQLDFILLYLYGKRSRFVHEGVAFSLESKEEKDYLGGGLLDVFYDHTKMNERHQVYFTLYQEDFFNFFEEALLNHCKGDEGN